MMTPKERLLAAIKGKKVDRLPWSPFLAYYWELLPQEVQNKGQLSFMERIGADPLFRGFHVLHKIKRNKCIIREWVKNGEKYVIYETTIGTLKERYVYSQSGHTWFLIDHPVKNLEDFKILTYINEDMQLIPHFDEFIHDYKTIGERGLYIPVIGSEMKTSFQSLVEHWVGTEELAYALADYPEKVEECLNAMKKNSIESAKISVESPAEAFIFWEDSSTTNISPWQFERYSVPEINEWGKILHHEGKHLIHHACGHLKALLPLMANTEVDMIESISPPPTGNIELWEARQMIPENIGLAGGIEPTILLNSSMEELEEYVLDLLKKMGTNRFILANSDSCPPGVMKEKFNLITDIVKQIS